MVSLNRNRLGQSHAHDLEWEYRFRLQEDRMALQCSLISSAVSKPVSKP